MLVYRRPILLSASVIVAVGALGLLLACARTQDSAPASDGATVPAAPTRTLPPTSSPQGEEVLSEDSAAVAIATPTPLVHVVEAGDTLYGIALEHGVSLDSLLAANAIENPDLLRIGQTIIVPPRAATPVTISSTDIPPTATEQAPIETASPAAPDAPQVGTVVPSPTSSGPPLVEIAQVLGSSILGEEVVIIRNRGGAVSLERWTLVGDQGGAYTFPALTLYPDAEARLHSETGTSGPTHLYWGRVEPAWQAGELLTLRDARGEVVDTYIVP
jgi:LysM repeat protein